MGALRKRCGCGTCLDADSDGVVDALDADGDGQPDDLDEDGFFDNEVKGLNDQQRYLPDTTDTGGLL